MGDTTGLIPGELHDIYVPPGGFFVFWSYISKSPDVPAVSGVGLYIDSRPLPTFDFVLTVEWSVAEWPSMSFPNSCV